MAKLYFNDLQFNSHRDTIQGRLYRIFQFQLPSADLHGISPFTIAKSSITFRGITERKARTHLNSLLQKSFRNLTNMVTKRPSYYIHRHLGIPLLGSQYFGIIDRNTNLIEIRPLTGCNLGCVYCSVDEGPLSKKVVDYVVEEGYLVEEFRKLVKLKDCDDIEAHINPQGEPLLYSPIVDLVHHISHIPGVCRVSMDTNGTLLTRKLIDRLVSAGLSNISISINTLDQNQANMLAGCSYNLRQVLAMAEYLHARGVAVTLAPVYLRTMNDDLGDLVQYAKSHGMRLGIQNFLRYPHGRNPVKEVPMDAFYERLSSLEQQSGVQLKLSAEDFAIHKTALLKVPFRKGERVKLAMALPGRLSHEMLGSARERVVAVRNYVSPTVTIVRTKHNIILAKN